MKNLLINFLKNVAIVLAAFVVIAIFGLFLFIADQKQSEFYAILAIVYAALLCAAALTGIHHSTRP